MSIYALKTFSDLVTSIREELGIASNDTTAINRIKRDINIVYSEVTSRKNWPWLTASVDLTVPAYINAGTASVTQNSNVVTLSVAPTSSKAEYKFSIDGYNEIYTIESHSANSTTVKLRNEFTGGTNATAVYKIWRDSIPLPIDFKETSQVWHDTYRKPVENVGRQEFRRISTQQPKNEGPVLYHYTGDYVDPSPTSSISSLPAISTRASAGVVKTIIFAGSLPAATISSVNAGEPVRWLVSGAGNATYNGEIIISSISTTSNPNDTITYTGLMELTESATADSSMSIVAVNTEKSNQRHRELFIYPYLNSARQTLHVDYFREVPPLNNDSDEPLIPMQDRVALRYGALHLSWTRMRVPDEATRNLQLYERKLAQMDGVWQDNLDTPILTPSKNYLGAKRNQWRRRAIDSDFGVVGGGGGGASQATGAANMVATFGNDGILVASGAVSTTELNYLDDVEALTSVTLADNQSSAATVASWSTSSYDAIILEYSIKRGASNKETGMIYLNTDGTSAAIAVSGATIGSTGVTFSADISGSSIRLRYVTTSTGTAATMKYKVNKWLS